MINQRSIFKRVRSRVLGNTLAIAFLACVCWAQSALSENTKAAKDSIQEATQFESVGDIPNALAKYKEALEKDPNNDYVKASILGLYCQTAPDSPDDPDLHLQIGQGLQFLGDFLGAEEEYLKAIRLSNGNENPEAERLLATISRSRTRDPEGKPVVPENKGAKQSRSPGLELDFDPYMAALQRQIKRAWFPPHVPEKSRIVLVFKIHKEGEMSNLRLITSSGLAGADRAALSAVKNAAPFNHLPEGASDVVDIQFTFDYNPVTGGGDGFTSRFTSRVPAKVPSEDDLNRLDLSARQDISLSRLYAEALLRSGKFVEASRLYKRISEALQRSGIFDRAEMSSVQSALSCANLLVNISQITNQTKLVSLIPECLGEIEKTDSFELQTSEMLQKYLIDCAVRFKIPLIEIGNALAARSDIGIPTKLSFTILSCDASPKSVDTPQQMAALKNHLSKYRGTIQNLAAANELDKEAFKFECAESYTNALELYRRSLALKEKNPGKYSEEALSGSVDIARVLAEQKRIPESKAAYEAAIASFKKAHISNDQYVILLETYGDMLNQIHQTKRAAALYAEAAAIAKKNAREK